MKYVKQLMIILAISFVGEMLNKLIPLPVPSGVYGLFLMVLLLCSKRLKLEDVEAVGNFMLEIMPIMFIPACVGIMESYKDVESVIIPISFICVISTIAVMAVAGWISQWIIKMERKES